nr:reverse transcriptase domain-containing protein [Tanacetum cinerariifolium]
ELSLCHNRIMPPKRRSQTNPQPTLTQEDVDQFVQDGIEAAIIDERERVATLGREVANGRPWSEVKQMMTGEFCPTEEVQRGSRKTIIKATTTTTATTEPDIVCYRCGARGHKSFECPKKANRRGGNVQGQAYVIRDAEHNQGPNVVTGRKYIEKGSQLFMSQVTEKEPAKKQLQDVPVICNFPEVFPHDLPGLPPPRQVKFKIELIPDAAPVTRAHYHLAPSKLKELSDQLKELSEKGFIRPSSSPWGAPIDLQFGYHQHRIREEDIPITTFQTRYGHFEFQVMSFGLTNVPVTKEDHEAHLKTILELLKNEKLYAKFSKCDFWLESVYFLGHVIESNGVHVDPAKVEAIRNWSAPTTPTEQASIQWNAKLTTALVEHGFEQSKYGYSLYIKLIGVVFVVLMVYVGDIVITESDKKEIDQLKTLLRSKFMIKDLSVKVFSWK